MRYRDPATIARKNPVRWHGIQNVEKHPEHSSGAWPRALRMRAWLLLGPAGACTGQWAPQALYTGSACGADTAGWTCPPEGGCPGGGCTGDWVRGDCTAETAPERELKRVRQEIPRWSVRKCLAKS